jgi:hypothetical protein
MKQGPSENPYTLLTGGRINARDVGIPVLTPVFRETLLLQLAVFYRHVTSSAGESFALFREHGGFLYWGR